MFKLILPIGFMTCCLISSEAIGQASETVYPNRAKPISLADSLTPLIDHFNSGKGKTRFIALLSATCPACVFGAKAVNESVLKAYPDADIQVSIVWIVMLPSDNEEAAIKSSAIFDDPRVKQFYDSDRKSGYAIGKDLLYKNAGPAWDIYLYYDKDAQWTDAPPKPIEWMHQLSGGRRADASRFTPGQELVKTLSAATAKLVNEIPVVTKKVDAPEPVAVNDEAALNGRALRVTGMDCQNCANLIESALAKIEGVTEVGADYEQGIAWVGFDSANAVEDDRLIEAITQVGFGASVIQNAIIQSGTSDDSDSATGSGGTELKTRKVIAGEVDRQSPSELPSLEDSLQPVIDRFNADRDKPRIVALLSPTCGGCVHAARALQKEIIEAYPDKDLSLIIVWEPMLGSDDKPSADKSSTIFNDPRVTQYWDGQRLSGLSYSTQVYADRFRQVSKVTPENHFLAAMLQTMADRSPEKNPMWDFALFYPTGVIWKDTPPKAQGFIRQLIYSPGQNGSGSTLLVDKFSQPPIQSDWFDEVKREMKALLSNNLSRNNNESGTIGQQQKLDTLGESNLQFLSFPDCPNSQELRQRLTAALTELGFTSDIQEINLQELDKADSRLCYGAPTILINGLDLMGDEPSDSPGLCCRIYLDGKLPSQLELIRLLKACYLKADEK